MFARLPLALKLCIPHQGTCCITLNCDGEAIADPDLLTRCMEAAFDEVVAAA